MDEERMDIPEIPEVTGPKVVHLRRHSTGIIGIPDGGIQVPPRYLRGSISSCHDLCKHGTKHTPETKLWKPVLSRTAESQSEGEDLERTETLAERKKKLQVSFSLIVKPIPGSKTEMPDESTVVKRESSSSTKKETVSLKQVSSDLKEIGISVKYANGPKLKPVKVKPSSLPTQDGSSNRLNREIRKSKELEPMSINSPAVSSSTRKGEIRSSNKMWTSERAEKKGLAKPSVSLSPKHFVRRVSSIIAKNSKNMKGVSPSMNQKEVSKPKPEQPSSEDVPPEKTLYIIESSNENRTVTPAENGVHASDLSPSSEDKSLKCAQSKIYTGQGPLSPGKKIMRCAQNGINVHQPPQCLSSSAEDKGLRRTRCGTHVTKSPLSLLTSNSSSKSTHDSIVSSERDDNDSENQISNSKMENKSRPKRGGIISSKYKHPLTQKLNFRREKVVDLQPEASSPRRLKFRQSVLRDKENDKGEAKRKNLEKIEADDGQADATVEINPEKVVLRHQNVETKKESECLFNNVIEETATKLAEGRKSKVRALVGAFETVISLQDTRSWANSRRR